MKPSLEKQNIAIFVDLTNFYSQFIKSDLGTYETLRKYFMTWFDFSALSSMFSSEASDVWIFYSGEKLGPKEAKITDDYLRELINRLNKQKGVTCYNVNISGEQREPFKSKCENCGNEAEAIWKSEKGIDSSLIVHLFDTMESWDKAYLFSGDADFVPAIRSLRRRGKVVSGVGFIKIASSALIRECFEYINLEDFFLQDMAIYALFKKDGLISDFFIHLALKQPLLHRYVTEELKQINLGISLRKEFESDTFNLQFHIPVKFDLSDWVSKSFALPLAWRDYQTEHIKTIQISFKDHLIAYIRTLLKATAQELQLDDAFDNVYQDNRQTYGATFNWDSKLGKYKRHRKFHRN